MPRIARNIFMLLASTFLGLGLQWWIYPGFNASQLFEVFTQRSNYLFIVLALAAGVLANVLRSWRWRMLLSSARIDITMRRAVELVFISYLINSVTPRLGELTRSLLVRRGDADVSTRALGTVVVEKLADVGCLVVVAGLAVTLRWNATVGLVQRLGDGLTWVVPNYTFYIAVGSAVCLLVGISFPLWPHIRRFVRNLWQGMAAIARLHSPLAFFSLSAGIWTCNFMQLYWLLPCFDSLSSICMADLLHVFAAASVGLLLPTPAGAGPWHFAIVKTLTEAYGVEKVAAQTFALISHGLKTALVMLLGLMSYLSFFASQVSRGRHHRTAEK